MVIPATDEYGIITFYVDPAIIPDEFDWMVSWFAPGALAVLEEDWQWKEAPGISLVILSLIITK